MHGLTCPLTMTGCASSHCLPRDAPEDNGRELEQFGELLVPLALGLPPVVRLALQGNHSVSHTPRKPRAEAGHWATFCALLAGGQQAGTSQAPF